MNIKDLVQQRRTVKENKKLIEEFPFLLPRNRFTGEVISGYDYEFTELDAIPAGWRKAFGLEMCREIKDCLVKNNYPLDQYRIMDIKEKYGTLRWYDNGHPEGMDEIISKYEDLSMCYCINCGNPTRYVTKGYIYFICEQCKDTIELKTERLTEEDIPRRMIFENNETVESPSSIDFKKAWGLNE